MSDRDDMAADILADREPMECLECGGTGFGFEDYGLCPYCGGTGVWEGRP